MAGTTDFSVRMDDDIKKQCGTLYGELGMELSTSINVFLRQSLRVGGFPFEVRPDQPNKEGIAAKLKVERIAHGLEVRESQCVRGILGAAMGNQKRSCPMGSPLYLLCLCH